MENALFKNVSFKYKESAQENVLSNINLHIEPGSTVGILGGTGSAKTSLVQLIDRLYDVSEGEILIDGHNVKDYSLEYLRDQVGMVLQKNTLFSGTVKENLLWGNKEASDEEIKWACKQACVDEFIENFPEGYDTYLEQGGVNVSGGQKQRAAVARAIITKPELILADEPTGALDSKATDSLLTLFSQINKEGQTVLMVTHSTKAASHANRVLFIKDGEIFHQLYRGSMSNEQLYAKISETLTVLTTGGENYE